jgi:hypothetical protein
LLLLTGGFDTPNSTGICFRRSTNRRQMRRDDQAIKEDSEAVSFNFYFK